MAPESSVATRSDRLRIRSWPLVLLAIGFIAAALYWAKLPLIVILVSACLALVLEPVVQVLEKVRISRPIAAALGLVVMLGALFGIVWLAYGQLVTFIGQLPRYTAEIRSELTKIEIRARRFKQTTESVLPKTSQVPTVKVQDETGLSSMVKAAGPVSEAIFFISFVPFLAYFMLSWAIHLRHTTVLLFPERSRAEADRTLALIAAAIRRFLLGNVTAALIVGTLSAVIFGMVGVPYFYFVGLISGLLNLVPYVGIVLAPLPPVIVGMGHIGRTDALIVAGTTIALHLVALNVLYPKLVGRQLALNPFVGTLALLVWGWLWGPIGLLFGIPITAALKVVFDHVEALRPYGRWLGGSNERESTILSR